MVETSETKPTVENKTGSIRVVAEPDKALTTAEVVAPSDQPPELIALKPSREVVAEKEAEVVEPEEPPSPADFLCEPFPITHEGPVRDSAGHIAMQEIGIWGILTGVMCVVFRLVDALKKYATDLAEILVGAMLGGAIARFGRNIIHRAMGMISL